MRVAILGLGEAGRFYATGFIDFGAEVSGFDPNESIAIPELHRADSVSSAADGADFVLSLVGATAAETVLVEALKAMSVDTVFADLNTGSPQLKKELAALAARSGVPFADVAVMAPVPRSGVMTPLIASGTGAERLAQDWSALGIPVALAGDEAGTAAGLKLLRSVFMKGLAALVIESVNAAENVGSAEWMRAEIAGELGPDGAALVDRLIDGTRMHAARREKEMQDVSSYLDSLGTPSWMSGATTQWLHLLAGSTPE